MFGGGMWTSCRQRLHVIDTFYDLDIKSYQSICQAFPRKTHFEIRGFSLAFANLAFWYAKYIKFLPKIVKQKIPKGMYDSA